MNFEIFKNDLEKYQPENIVFVGLGNELRGDDYAGILFLNELKKQKEFFNSTFLNAGTNPENYLYQLTESKADVIVFIDAVKTKSYTADVNWLEQDQIEMISVSTHSFSIKMLEQFINSRRHTEFKYVGISVSSFDYGRTISYKVIESIKNFFLEPHMAIEK
jgi:hydrogenase 3 maturation protease